MLLPQSTPSEVAVSQKDTLEPTHTCFRAAGCFRMVQKNDIAATATATPATRRAKVIEVTSLSQPRRNGPATNPMSPADR